jgi:FlaA1/EpsC-like NDP-sugar epimerase
MTGMGLTRFLSSHTCRVLGFVDSDTSLADKEVCGLKVFSPTSLGNLAEQFPDLVIIIAVSIKELEIKKQIVDMGLSQLDVEVYSDYCESFYTVDIMGSCNLK